jgi:hypothetical protein
MGYIHPTETNMSLKLNVRGWQNLREKRTKIMKKSLTSWTNLLKSVVYTFPNPFL